MNSTPRHPGVVLVEDFMKPLGLTVGELAELSGVHPQRLYVLARGEGRISLDAAVRLGHVFRIRPQHWLAMQTEYDLAQMERPTDARRANLRGFVTGPNGVHCLPPPQRQEPVDTSFPAEMRDAVSKAAALLAPFRTHA